MDRRPLSDDELLEWLGKELRTQPVEAFVEHLREDGYFSQINSPGEDRDAALQDLLAAYRKQAKTHARANQEKRDRRRAPPRELSPSDQLTAAVRGVAVGLGRSPEVDGFRTQYLGERLLHPEEVDGWIERQVAEDGPAYLPRTSATSIGGVVRYSEWRARELAVGALRFYGPPADPAVPDQPTLRFVYVAPNGILDQLRRVALDMAERFGSSEEEAVRFVLTGTPPVVPRARIEVSMTEAPLMRIRLDVYAGVSPVEVKSLYQQCRRDLEPPRTRAGAKRTRAELVDFWADTQEMGWTGRLVEWNRRRPEAPYSSVSNMQRDIRRARGLGSTSKED